MTTASPAPVSPAPTASPSLTGCVKWFNNKAGYGFITVTDGPKTGTDIFVHHSSIKVDSNQYKYLVQGEYTEFALSTVGSNDHECQAADVCGIKGGKLMCETRYDARSMRTTYKDQDGPKSRSKVVTDTVVPVTSEWTPARKPRQLAVPSEDKSAATTSRPSSTAGRGRGRGPSSTAGRGRGGRT